MVILDLSNLVEESEIVDVGCAGEVHDPGEPVVLDVAEGDVPLVISLRCRIRDILPKGQVPVHDAGGPQHRSGGGGFRMGLDDDPQERWRDEAQGVRQSPQERALEPVVRPGGGNNDQQPP